MRTDRYPTTTMQQEFEHPSDDSLERFLLHQMDEKELEGVETHILACQRCVDHLEDMELNLAATRMALAELHKESVAVNYAAEMAAREKKSVWARLFNVRSLSFAGAAAALALSLMVAPRYTPVDKEMSAFRGPESNVIPAGRPVRLHLNAKDLPETQVSLEVVNAEDGAEVWNSSSKVDHQVVNTKLPPIDTKGNYLLRIYSPGSESAKNTHGELLREFAFDVQ